uniref:Uncharacterized protein n=1 Tax=Tanacetum cinerariifolium TaxID=118510 RepID=A0A6L2MIV2_TANCI|nr:hypothetical protein [Tanacetum cinerariifolium]
MRNISSEALGWMWTGLTDHIGNSRTAYDTPRPLSAGNSFMLTFNALKVGGKREKGNKKRAPEAKQDYIKLTDEEKKALAGKEVGQNKHDSSDYHVISYMNRFVKFIRKIPANNQEKLTESPFKHFLELKNETLLLNNICVTLSHKFDDKKLQLGKGEVLDVTEDHFWELMKIKKMDPIDPKNIDVTVKEKFYNEKNQKFYDISMVKVKNVLNNVDESIDNVNRAFTLLAMHSLIFPPKRSSLHQNEGLDLLVIDEGNTQEFSLKWKQNYSHLSASIGYSQPLVNKILRNTVDAGLIYLRDFFTSQILFFLSVLPALWYSSDGYDFLV